MIGGSELLDGFRSVLEVRAAAFDRLGGCAAVLDSDGVIVETNQAWRLFAHLNGGSGSTTGIGVNYLEVCDRAARSGIVVADQVAAGLRQILNGDRNQIDAEYACPSPTEDRWFLMQACALPVRNGAGAVVSHLDITARKQLTDRLVALAEHDPLTGLPNRRAALGYLDDALATPPSDRTATWVLFIDINEFKAVNDSFGHHVGDELLVKVALRARRALRADDHLCRFGGDEFVVICAGLDRDQAQSLADRLRGVMSAPFQIGDLEIFGRISIGVAGSDARSTPESMLRTADEDMYADKRRSRSPAPSVALQLQRRPWASSDQLEQQRPGSDAFERRPDELARAVAALRNSNDLILFFAADGTIEWASPACGQVWGINPDDLVGRNGVDLIHPDDQAAAMQAFMSIPHCGDQVRADFRVVDAEGRIRWIEEIATNLLDDPSVGSVIGNLRDITERVELLERVELDHRRLADAQAAACLGSFEIDLDTGEISRSDELCRILGVPVGSGANSSTLDTIHPDDRHKLTAMLQQAAAGRDRGELEYRIVRPTGEVRWVLSQGVKLPGRNVNVIAGTMRDITDRKAARDALTFQATHDWLTGLPNPASLHAGLQQLLSDLATNAHVMVAVVGIDNFRPINDVSGSMRGDEVLRALAAQLRTWAQPGDVIGRVRGDEFMVARTFHGRPISAIEFGSTLKRALGDALPVAPGNAPIDRLLFSVGITTSKHGDSAESMLADANAAMSDAKLAGGDRVVVFDDEARARATRRRTIASALTHAIERNQLRLEYQPVLDLTSLDTVGFEALLRWTHPDLGPIAPNEFIPIAEANGLIVAIGEWVIDRALQQLGDWHRNPDLPEGLWMAVNVSAQQLSHEGLVARVGETIERCGVPASAVHLEITESVLLDRIDRALPTIAGLHRLGVEIAIDDFGTGYSSLSYLSRLPVNTLKIDRSFVNALTVDHCGGSIIRAIANLADSLGLHVIAEGVETVEQLETLRALGCTTGQGFLWSPALHPDSAEQWMTTRHPAPTGAGVAATRNGRSCARIGTR
jgi:diguanylate cyclase (GGDEF)-like protein/PAS domain S-box-containing protein